MFVTKHCTYISLEYISTIIILFCTEEGNKFPKMLDLYIKVLLRCNEVVCHSMVVQLMSSFFYPFETIAFFHEMLSQTWLEINTDEQNHALNHSINH